MSFKKIDVTDIKGFRLGNAEDVEGGTGCTVVICEEGAMAGVDVRGGGPSTRETDLLRSENSVQAINAVVLSGGSAFGLEAGSGVMRYLSEKGIGPKMGDLSIPLVCQASLFDMGVGKADAYPDLEMGKVACENAYNGEFKHGNHGAGTGATVGKFCGMSRAMKAGLGTFACSDGVVSVGAITAVNAFADIYNGNNNIIAGLRSADGEWIRGTIQSLKNSVRVNVEEHEEPEIRDLFVIKRNKGVAAYKAPKPKAVPVEQVETAEEAVHATAENTEPMAEAQEEAVQPAELKPVEAAPAPVVAEPVQPEATQNEPAVETETVAPAEEILAAQPETEEVVDVAEEMIEEDETEVVSEEAVIPEEITSDEVVAARVTEPVAEPEVGSEIQEEDELNEVEELPAEEPAAEVTPEEIPAAKAEEKTVVKAVEKTIEKTDEPVVTVEMEEPEPPRSELTERALEVLESMDPLEAFDDLDDDQDDLEFDVDVTEPDLEEDEVEEDVWGYDVSFNTTISCLITNAKLTKPQANKLASILHDGYARAIKPVHSSLDGDTVFVLTTNEVEVNFDAFAGLATDIMQYSIIDGAMAAEDAYGLPSARSMK